MLLTAAARRLLETTGWVSVDGIDNSADAQLIANTLGRSTQDTSRITPKPRGRKGPRSFSYRHGYGQFPMHTDTAFWPIPARFILLTSATESEVPTLLLPTDALASVLSELKPERAIFALNTASGFVYQGFNLDGRPGTARLDQCYMQPVNSSAHELINRLSFPAKELIAEHRWTGKNVLIIDNWRCLHGRAEVTRPQERRSLTRFYVCEDEHELEQRRTME